MKKEKQQMPSGGMSQEESGAATMPGATVEKQQAGGMGSANMEADGANRSSAMPMMEIAGGQNGSDETRNVIVEIRIPSSNAPSYGLQMGAGLTAYGFQLDYNYEPVPLTSPGAQQGVSETEGQIVLVRGTVPASRIAELKQQPNVINVWNDTNLEHFDYDMETLVEEEPEVKVISTIEGLGTCPIGTCDCTPGIAKGSLSDVVNYLGVNQIWSSGFKGDGIVIGVVDGGITAQGRPINPGDTGRADWPNKLIPRVIGGWPTADWGTTGAAWGWHANMCSTDVLGIAPNAQLYDIRIAAASLPPTLSNAIAGYQWAINQHKVNGTPHILTNSWGIYQPDPNDPNGYATDPNHPLTKKIVEAIDEGILVLFAAGNCGGTCPDGRCGTFTGPGKDIWGANGHPRVMTVGAVNKNEQFVGYSSQGPAALDPHKPDFCSITHFQGFFPSDNGTSAATPIAAGVVALLKQAKPSLTQDQAKAALISTAKDIGPAGWDQHSGAGIIQPQKAFGGIAVSPKPSGPVVSWAPNRLDVFVIGTDKSLYHKWWNGAWGPSLPGYENLGGTIISSPEVVSWAQNRLDVFVVGTNSSLYHKWWNGAWGPSINGYENLGGTIIGQPKAVSWGPNRLDIFVVGTDSSLYHKWWNGAAWGPSILGYENLGGKIIGSPEVVSWGPNRLDVFVVGTDSSLYHKWWDGASWKPSIAGWENLGGTIIGQPKAVAWGPNRLDIFVVGTNSALYHKWWDGISWKPSINGYESLGGTIIGSPEVVSWAPNRLDVFVTGTDSALYHKWWNGASWGPSLAGYESLGGVLLEQPRAVSWASNRLDVFVLGTNSALYHKWWNGAWGPSLAGYENLGGVITKF